MGLTKLCAAAKNPLYCSQKFLRERWLGSLTTIWLHLSDAWDRDAVPDKSLNRWFPPLSECPHWRWGFTAKGWTNNEYTIEWLKEIFIP